MTDILYARSQMAMSLGFHIIFAAIGVALPLLMVISEWRYLRTGDSVYKEITKRWAKGTAVLFAVGAVSGTVLSFELGLLFPSFMERAGPIIGMPFSLEGFAFFLEAIFLGIYLYGWERISQRAHLFAGIMVAISGAASASFVTLVNAWMNTPRGFSLAEDGSVTDIRLGEAMFTPAATHEIVHSLLAYYLATAFAVAGVHAFFLLRDRHHAFHRKAFGIALGVAAIASVFQLVSADLAAKAVAELQPIKLAAMEGLYQTTDGAPLALGGIPDDAGMTMDYAIEIPGLLSFLAYGDFDATVQGLEEFPRDEWPNVPVVHIAYQVMVGAGMTMFSLAFLALGFAIKRRAVPDMRWLLRAFVLASPLGFIAIEAGWVVTEVGRQPWIVYGIWRTNDAVTPVPGLAVPFWTFTLLYVLLAVAVAYLLRRQFRTVPESGGDETTWNTETL